MTVTARLARAGDIQGIIPLLKQLMTRPSTGSFDGLRTASGQAPSTGSGRAERDWGRVSRALGEVIADGRLGTVQVAEEDSALLGVVTQSYVYAVRFGGWYSQIEELVVDEAARGKGVGAMLVQASIAEARRRGCAEIGLWALPHNVPFYESQGFKLTGGPYLSQQL